MSKQHCHSIAGVAIGAVLAIALTGCGNGLASVTGQITVDGEPLASGGKVSGTVFYFPDGGSGAPAVGQLDEEGRYELSTGSQAGIAPGGYYVTVSAVELIPSKMEGGLPSGRSIVPRRYNDPTKSGFRASVDSGWNEFDFAIDSTPDATSSGKRRRRR